MSHATHPLMIVIICAKCKNNPSRTVDATERIRFSSKLNDLEDIGQGQGSSHVKHPLMPLIICTKYGKNASWTVDATGQTRKVKGQRQMDRQGESNIPPKSVAVGIKMSLQQWDSQHKDKVIMALSYLYNGDSYTGIVILQLYTAPRSL